MSRYGDNRQHMEYWHDLFDERVKEVGYKQAMLEWFEVMNRYLEYQVDDDFGSKQVPA